MEKQTKTNEIVLIPDSVIKASYSNRLHKIVKIYHDCTCGRLSDELGLTDSGMQEKSPPHLHLVCRDMQDNQKSYFGGYVIEDSKIVNVWRSNDELIIISLPKKTIQLTLF